MQFFLRAKNPTRAIRQYGILTHDILPVLLIVSGDSTIFTDVKTIA